MRLQGWRLEARFHDTNVSKLRARDEVWSRRGPDAIAVELPLPSSPPMSAVGWCSPMDPEVLVVPNDAERMDTITEGEEDCATRNISLLACRAQITAAGANSCLSALVAFCYALLVPAALLASRAAAPLCSLAALLFWCQRIVAYFA